MSAIEQKLFEQIRRLDDEQQKQVLYYVRQPSHVAGEPVRDIIQHARELDFAPEDLEQMEQFIKEDFERIEWDDWNNPPAFPD